MSEAIAVDIDAGAPGAAKLPPVVPLPKFVQGIGFTMMRMRMLQWAARRYGQVFTLTVPLFGRMVVVADPTLVKRIYTASTDDLINLQPNLSRLMGPGCVFALDGAEHRDRRKLLTPPFHGRSIKNYEHVIEEETLRECANWPEDKEFRTLEPMMRVTLNVVLRTVFGADGVELDRLRRMVPGWVTLGSRLFLLPMPGKTLSRFGPWGKFAAARREFDAIVKTLIAKAEADPNFDERTDILSLMLRSRYDDGSSMSHQEISDELVALLTAGHETTASTLAWAFERLRRHPQILAALADEANGDANELRQATILEVQRTRTVIEFSGRDVAAPSFQLGDWRIPHGWTIVVSILQLHADPEAFPDPDRFDPYRYVGKRPPTFKWLAFGGGSRRCIGAAFANTEMDVVLRTILRRFTIDPTTEPGEKMYNRGVAYVPKNGGRIVVRRRTDVA